jgi:ATP-dependent helicase/nuclease subunit A
MRFLEAQTELAAPAGAICDSVLAILDDPALAEVFAPGSRAEIPLAGIVGDVEIGGLVDRLAVTANRVILADYKTDRTPPAGVEDVPVGYLRQLAAYRAILMQIYPQHAVDCLLIWTEAARAMPIPAALLQAQAPA